MPSSSPSAGRGWTTPGPGYHPAPDPVDVETRLAERLPVVAGWTRTFDTAGYLTSVGLTGAQLRALRELLRP